jgi:hypothetical protein
MRKETIMQRVLLGFCAVLLLQAPVFGAQTYYVAANAPSGNSCSSAINPTTPVNTINKGAACLQPGDTLIIKDGTYPECLEDVIPSGQSASQPTTVKAEHLRKAILTGPGDACSASLIHIGQRGSATSQGVVRHYITLDGLFLDMPTDRACFGVKVSGGIEDGSINGSHDLQFLNLEIRGGMNTGRVDTFTIGIGQGGNQFGWTFRGNYFHDIGMVGATDQQAAWSYGVYISGSDNLFENNEFARLSGFGFHGYSTGNHLLRNIIRNNYIHDVGGGGLLICGSDNQIYNNLIARAGIGPANSSNWGGIRLAVSCSGVQANNNLIYYNTIVRVRGDGVATWCINLGGSVGGTSSANNNTVRNNICYLTTPDDHIHNTSSGSGSNTIDHNLCTGAGCSTSGNPLFAKTIPDSDLTAAGIRPEDFQIQEGSPAQNAGVSTASGTPLITTDYGGNQRQSGAAPDMGAWARGGAPGQVPAPMNLRRVGAPQ